MTAHLVSTSVELKSKSDPRAPQETLGKPSRLYMPTRILAASVKLYLFSYFLFFLNFSLVIQNQTGYLLRQNVMLLSIVVEHKVHLH